MAALTLIAGRGSTVLKHIEDTDVYIAQLRRPLWACGAAFSRGKMSLKRAEHARTTGVSVDISRDRGP